MYLNTAADLHIHEVVQQVARVFAKPAPHHGAVQAVAEKDVDCAVSAKRLKKGVTFAPVGDHVNFIVKVSVCLKMADLRERRKIHVFHAKSFRASGHEGTGNVCVVAGKLLSPVIVKVHRQNKHEMGDVMAFMNLI
jgi:hypothetical protein